MNGWGRPCSGENTVTVHIVISPHNPQGLIRGAPRRLCLAGRGSSFVLLSMWGLGSGVPQSQTQRTTGRPRHRAAPWFACPGHPGALRAAALRGSPQQAGTQGLSLVLGALTPPASPFRHLPFLESLAGAQHSLCTPWGEYFKHRNEQVRRRI